MKGNNEPVAFGGVHSIFVGDFGHLALVPQFELITEVDGKAAVRHRTVEYAFSSAAWAHGKPSYIGSHTVTATKRVGSLVNFFRPSLVARW